MRRHIRPYLARHEQAASFVGHVKSGTGAVAGMALVGGLSTLTGLPLLMAPLGATAVLLFGQAQSPLAQPANVFFGYLLATALGVGVALSLPGVWWAAAIAVGIAVGLMLAFRVTHPPAGAVPLVAMGAPQQPAMLFASVLIGSVALVALAVLHHRLPPRAAYPRPTD